MVAERAWRLGQHRNALEHVAPAQADAEKKTLEASERAREKVAQARRLWAWLRRYLDPRRLIFLDETWLKTNMARLYGWARRGLRVIGRVPHGHWRTTTFVAGLRQDRVIAPMLIEGAINGPIFRAWVEQALAPLLSPGDIVIADNLRCHKVAGVREAIEARGAMILFLPPYSPDENPIEELFAKLKTVVHRLAPRSRNGLEAAVKQALELVSSDECANYLANKGYGHSG